MKAPACITVDFETWPIGQRPKHYPPKPVGVATKWPGQQSNYLSWGSMGGNNNADEIDGNRELQRVWDSGLPILCHHSKFDVAVATEAMSFPMLPWERIHDTMFLAYLCDPHSRSIGLKELAADLLSWPADEQDRVADWIMANKVMLHAQYGAKYGLKRPTPKKTGAYIGFAPGDIVDPYARGDVDRTEALFEHLWPLVQENGMGAAYTRERRLMPILLKNEREGMRTDLEGLARDCATFGAAMEKSETWLRKELKASGLNFDADQDVASVLEARGLVTEWSRTAGTKAHPEGQLSVSKDTLRPEHFTDPRIASALGYRNRLKTCLGMFMEPWRDQAQQYGGYITTNWNQTTGAGGGTRTGRPSTNKHNFLNISKDFESKRDDGYVHPLFLDVPNLPLCRKYILPDEGEVFLHRDFSGQEMRVFAHLENGALFDAFNANPALDPHEMIGEELMRVAGREIDRTRVKTLNFQSLYGGGIPALQLKLRCSYAEAKELKAFHDRALPGRKIVTEEIKLLVAQGLPIRTWGGRLYFVEPPRYDDKRGRHMTYDYKLINYWVQGSAADLTKQSIIDWDEAKDSGSGRFLISVYDEIDITAPAETCQRAMKLLRDVMEAPRLTVPMLSDGKQGPNWGSLTKCD